MSLAASLPYFGRGRQVGKRQFALAEVRLNGIEPDKLLSPKDATLEDVQRKLLLVGAALAATAAYGLHVPPESLFWSAVGLSFLGVVDQVAWNGGGWSLVLDAAGRALRPDYAQR